MEVKALFEMIDGLSLDRREDKRVREPDPSGSFSMEVVRELKIKL